MHSQETHPICYQRRKSGEPIYESFSKYEFRLPQNQVIGLICVLRSQPSGPININTSQPFFLLL